MKKIRILFITAVMLILVVGLARAVLLPEEINTYENRYANQMPGFLVSAFMDGTYQDGVDAALMDQLPLAATMKNIYNRVTGAFLKSGIDIVQDTVGMDDMRYLDFKNMCLFGEDYVTYRYVSLWTYEQELNEKIASLNRTFLRHPELDFYVYYIEKDTDIDFENGKKNGLADYLISGLELPEDSIGVYCIDSFEEFTENFYKTDTHWNDQGSYRAYCQLLKLLDCPEQPLEPTGTPVLIDESFSGSKAFLVAGKGVFTEPFYGVPYSFPDMFVSINGVESGGYGQQNTYLSGQAEVPVSYGNYYGEDNGETILSTGTTGRGKLLVVGESFDNAVLKLLASHYDTLYSIDLRYYEHSMGKAFDFGAYTKEHGIDQVLLMGNIDFFIQDTFDLED